MADYKYTLIVSQYDYSRHLYIVKHDPETFIQNAENLATELEKYKRDDDDKRDIVFGDLTCFKQENILSRYNINDQGDIYFINAVYANYLIGEAIEYYEYSRIESAGFKKKVAREAIQKHHNGLEVKTILRKYFEIV